MLRNVFNRVFGSGSANANKNPSNVDITPFKLVQFWFSSEEERRAIGFNPRSLYDAGVRNLENNNIRSARKSFQKIFYLKLREDENHFHHWCGDALYRREFIFQSVGVERQAMTHWQASLDARHVESPQTMFRLGYYYLKIGELEQAVKVLDNMLLLYNEDHKIIMLNESAVFRLMFTIARKNQNDFDKDKSIAIQYLSEALKLVPENSSYRFIIHQNLKVVETLEFGAKYGVVDVIEHLNFEECHPTSLFKSVVKGLEKNKGLFGWLNNYILEKLKNVSVQVEARSTTSRIIETFPNKCDENESNKSKIN